MNYLAHLYLSQQNQALSLLGNLMGDFCKGVDLRLLPAPVQRGISNHRAVDQFTDNHPIVRDLKTLFEGRLRRFAGVITDVVFDHFLIKHWSIFSQTALNVFIQRAYDSLWLHREWMPNHMVSVVERMIEQDWLIVYSTVEGVDMTLQRMSQRIRFENPLAESKVDIIKNYTKLDDGFLQFFPELIKYIDHIAIEVKQPLIDRSNP